jgi:hypothetical protein
MHPGASPHSSGDHSGDHSALLLKLGAVWQNSSSLAFYGDLRGACLGWSQLGLGSLGWD